jgi:hypothetical protein
MRAWIRFLARIPATVTKDFVVFSVFPENAGIVP